MKLPKNQVKDNMDNIASHVVLGAAPNNELFQMIFICGEEEYRINLLPSVFNELKERMNSYEKTEVNRINWKHGAD